MILFYSGDSPFDIAGKAGLRDDERTHETRRASIDRALEQARPGLLTTLLSLVRGQRGELERAVHDPRMRDDLGLRAEQVQRTLGRAPGAPHHLHGWF